MAQTRGDHAVKGKLNVSGDGNFSKGLNSPYLEVIDQKDPEVPGGTFSGNEDEVGWVTRDLTNTVFDDFSVNVTLAANPGEGGSIELAQGTYYCEISCPAFNVNEHIARLADVTDASGNSASTVVLGTSEFAADTALWQDGTPAAMTIASASQTRSHVTGKFRLSSQRTLEVQHRCANTQTVDGLGSAGAFYIIGGDADTVPNNVFTIVKMWQLESE